MEIAREIGGHVLKNVRGLKVDVTNPETLLIIEVRESTYVYIEKIPALGGMPVGTNGKGLLLVSGGIDSPVAGFMLARRGVEIDALMPQSKSPFSSMNESYMAMIYQNNL